MGSEQGNEDTRSSIDQARQPLLVKDGASSGPNPYNRGILFKLLVLLCVSMVSFGSYFSYDSVSALETHITDDLKLSGFEYGLLFSVYSFPNMVLVLVGGFVIDRIGNRVSGVLLCGLIAAGTGIVAVAANVRSYWLMLFGRFVFGLGSESSYVAQNNMCVEWFSNKYLAIAMGATVSVSRLGSVTAWSFEAMIADKTGSYQFALWAAFLVCMGSLVFCVLYFVLDKWAKAHPVAPPAGTDTTGDRNTGDTGDSNSTDATAAAADSDFSLSKMFSWKVIRSAFGLQYWLWVAIAVTIYSTIFPFRAVASAQIAEKWGFEEDDVGPMMSTIDLASLFFSPLCGWIVDYTGKRAYLVILGNIMGMVGYLVLGFTRVHPLVGLVILGLHFSLMPAALWPCVPYLTHPKHTGLAFAVVSALINAALTVIIPLAGELAEVYHFGALCLLFTGISGLSVLLAVAWNLVDAWRPRPILNEKGPPPQFPE